MTIYRWRREFQRRNFIVEDTGRTGKPKMSLTEKIVDEDGRVTYSQVKETLDLNTRANRSILNVWVYENVDKAIENNSCNFQIRLTDNFYS